MEVSRSPAFTVARDASVLNGVIGDTEAGDSVLGICKLVLTAGGASGSFTVAAVTLFVDRKLPDKVAVETLEMDVFPVNVRPTVPLLFLLLCLDPFSIEVLARPSSDRFKWSDSDSEGAGSSSTAPLC